MPQAIFFKSIQNNAFNTILHYRNRSLKPSNIINGSRARNSLGLQISKKIIDY